MRAHALSLFVIAMLAAACGGGEFTGGAAGSTSDDASAGASGSGGKAGAGGTAGTGVGGGSAGGALDASAEAETGPACPGTQKLCGTECVDTSSNPDHCGGCDKACDPDHGAGSCVAGVCSVTSCTAGYGDCNDDASDGCETAVSSSTEHCGECGKACAAPNASGTCEAGVCKLTCSASWENCNANDDDGCEADLTSTATCGSCNNACASPHASYTCESGCKFKECETGWGDCNASLADGCEADLLNDPATCGTCSNKCQVANGEPGCVNGACTVKGCAAGFSNCDGDVANGCETKTGTDVFNCGECGRACSEMNVMSMQCVSGLCTSTCDMLSANVSMPASGDDDGCETPVASDTKCGSATNDCTKLNGSMSCKLSNGGSLAVCGCDPVGSQCGPGTCSNGLCVCDGDTCQSGERCSTVMGVAACRCGLDKCAAGQVCCNSPAGCVSITVDPNNCGACGHKCPEGFLCSNGGCTCSTNASCNAGGSGVCAQGVCTCATKCQPGQRCLANGTCG